MFKKIIALAAVLMLTGFAAAAFASEAAEGAAGAAAKVAAPHSVSYFAFTVIAVGIGLGIAAAGCGVGQGIAISRAVEGISRQPEATQKIQLNLLIGLAIIESLVLYTLFIGIILLYANPFTSLFLQ